MFNELAAELIPSNSSGLYTVSQKNGPTLKRYSSKL